MLTTTTSFVNSNYIGVQKIELSDRIRAIMVYEDLNARQFERKTKISYSSIIKYLKGERKDMTSDIAEKILTAFPHISARYLYSGKGHMLAPETREEELIKELERKEKELESYRKMMELQEKVIELREKQEKGKE